MSPFRGLLVHLSSDVLFLHEAHNIIIVDLDFLVENGFKANTLSINTSNSK